MKYHDNIKKRRQELRMTQSELAQKAGYTSKSTISRIEKGEIDLSQSMLDAIAKALQTTPGALLFSEPDNDTVIFHDSYKTSNAQFTSSPNAVRIPVCGEIAGGYPMNAIEEPIDPNDPDTWEEIPKAWLAGDKQIIALRVHGDSMEPRICDGDVAIIERCYEWRNGAVMAVYVNGDNATLKQVHLQPNGILTLKPFNPLREAYSYTPEEQESLPVKPLGILKELRAKF